MDKKHTWKYPCPVKLAELLVHCSLSLPLVPLKLKQYPSQISPTKKPSPKMPFSPLLTPPPKSTFHFSAIGRYTPPITETFFSERPFGISDQTFDDSQV